MLEERESGARGKEAKIELPADKNVCRFKKVQSDDPQSPDSLCNTFTKAGGEGENPAPLFIPLIIPPLSPGSLGVRNEH